jgi:hypothetical protein
MTRIVLKLDFFFLLVLSPMSMTQSMGKMGDVKIVFFLTDAETQDVLSFGLTKALSEIQVGSIKEVR